MPRRFSARSTAFVDALRAEPRHTFDAAAYYAAGMKTVHFAILAALFASRTGSSPALAQTPPPCDAICIAEAVHGVAADGAQDSREPSPQPFTPGLSAPPRNLQAAFLPKGVIFPVQTMQSYSAYGSAPGSKVRYELLQDVVINGFLFAMKGDTAEGTVQAAHEGSAFPLRGIGGGSDLRVSVDKVYNFCGDTIAVDFDRSEYRDFRGNWNWLMLVGIGFFLKPDKDVHIVRGQQYAAFSNRPQHVCAAPTTQPDSEAPAAALLSTDR
jgi:hypothetical protein